MLAFSMQTFMAHPNRKCWVSLVIESPDGKTIEPMMAHGIQAMSIGLLIDAETPMVWRGPMVTQALQQLLNDTRWHDLDYLVIDLHHPEREIFNSL